MNGEKQDTIDNFIGEIKMDIFDKLLKSKKLGEIKVRGHPLKNHKDLVIRAKTSNRIKFCHGLEGTKQKVRMSL